MVEAALKPIVSPYSSPRRFAFSSTDSPARERIPLASFSAVKQAEIFGKLREKEFSGRLCLSDRRGVESVFYFYLGRLVFATGGLHPVRRWWRSLAVHCPEIGHDIETLGRELSEIEPNPSIAWEYRVLSEWAKQRKLTLDQLNGIVRYHVEEILFDLTRTDRVQFYQEPDRMDGFIPLTVINPEQAIANTWKQWQDWQSARLADRSPDRAPAVKSRDDLAKQASPLTLELLLERCNGQNSLRDLAAHLRQDLVALTRSLLVYVQTGAIELVEIDDLPAPIDFLTTPAGLETIPLTIAYGDADQLACQRFAERTRALGHHHVTVRDGLQAITLFVETKPDLILLSSRLLHMDGYTILKALRQIPRFQKTPIVIVSDTVGLSDRIRAKISGASEIIEKYPTRSAIRQLIEKYFGKDLV
jgi:chemotaxis family two-component system response regulator PixG